MRPDSLLGTGSAELRVPEHTAGSPVGGYGRG